MTASRVDSSLGAGDRYDDAAFEVVQARRYDIGGIHTRNGAEVDALARVKLGANDAGADDLNPDAGIAKLAREHLRERHQERLARGVDGTTGKLGSLPAAAEGE